MCISTTIHGIPKRIIKEKRQKQQHIVLRKYIKKEGSYMKEIKKNLYAIIALAVILLIICAYIQMKGYVKTMVTGYVSCFLIIINVIIIYKKIC